jgi:hypothetical protein
VFEIRRRSGLTWEELADVFAVSRRSIHNWASGKAVSSQHEQLIRKTLQTLRLIPMGAAGQMRDFLLGSDDRAVAPIALLKSGEFDEVLARAEMAAEFSARLGSPISAETREARKPPAPTRLRWAGLVAPVSSLLHHARD